MSDKRSMLGLTLWLIICSVIIILVYINWPQGIWLKTTFDDLIPSEKTSPLSQDLHKNITQKLGAKTVWLIGAKDSQATIKYARQISLTLKNSQLFKQVNYQIDTKNTQQLYQNLYQYRYQLLSPLDRQILYKQPQEYFQQQLTLIYSPLGSFYASRLKEDPAGIFWNYYQQQVTGNVEIVDKVLIFTYNKHYYALVVADLKKSSLEFKQAPNLMRLYTEIKSWSDNEKIKIHATGMPLFSAYGAQSGHNEILTVGTTSLIAITLLLLLTFRSIRPMLLTILVVGTGTAGGLIITVLITQQIHVITLVFGAAVIGISVDYAFHYLCSIFDTDWSPAEGIKRVLPSLSLGFLSSGLAFLCLTLVPFSGVQHIGIFMASGLLCSWLTVVLACPALMYKYRAFHLKSLPLLLKPVNLLCSRKTIIFIIIIISAPGLFKLNFGDDIRIFYAKPLILSDDEAMFKKIIPSQLDSRYLQIHSNSIEQLLQIEESLETQLKNLVDNKTLDGFNALSTIIPSISRQRENWDFQKELFQSAYFKQYFQQLGFHPKDIEQVKFDINHYSFSPLIPEDIKDTLSGSQLNLLPLCQKNQCSSIIQLRGIHSLVQIQSLADSHNQITLVDKVAATTKLMEYYRNGTTILIFGTLILTFIVLAFLRGLSASIQIVTIPLLAIIFSLSILGYLHQTISLFNTLALLLILGVSIDYAIFTHSAKPSEQISTALAITLSIITTILAFGLLAISETPAIRSFGLTLIPGLLAAYFIAASSFSTLKLTQETVNVNP